MSREEQLLKVLTTLAYTFDVDWCSGNRERRQQVLKEAHALIDTVQKEHSDAWLDREVKKSTACKAGVCTEYC